MTVAAPVVEHLAIPGPDGAIPTIVSRPPADRSSPAVILLHGQGRKSSKEAWREDLLILAAAGITAVAVDARLHGERRRPEVDTSGAIPILDFHAMLSGTAADVRAVASHLLTRQDWCNGEIGVIGFSLGACVALVSAANDERLDPLVLMATPIIDDDDAEHFPGSRPDARILKEAVAANDPYNFLERYPPRRMLFVHGEHDLDEPIAAVRSLHAALAARYPDPGDSLTLLTYKDGHHPPPRVRRRALLWLIGALVRSPHGLGHER